MNLLRFCHLSASKAFCTKNKNVSNLNLTRTSHYRQENRPTITDNCRLIQLKYLALQSTYF